MTKTIDNLLVMMNFDRDELEDDKTRTVLYLMVLTAFLFSAIFIPLALYEILR